MARNYGAVVRKIRSAVGPERTRDERMQAVVDALWEAFGAQGYSWVGFYTPEASGGGEVGALILRARRDKPACSPLAMHGVCGQVFRSGRTMIVRDALDLGANYVACDPRDRAEIAVPLFESGAGGAPRCWGVLDIDSHEAGVFDESDEAGLLRVLEAAGLCASAPAPAR